MAKRKHKQIEMPTPKWYAVYNAGSIAEGELRDILLQDLERIKDGNKAVRGESYGTGPWFAIRVGRDCVVKQAPEGAVGPYFTPHIALDVAEALNMLAPLGCPIELKVTAIEKVLSRIEQMKMELA